MLKKQKGKSREKIIKIPDDTVGEEPVPEENYCLSCGELAPTDPKTGLCEDCIFKEEW